MLHFLGYLIYSQKKGQLYPNMSKHVQTLALESNIISKYIRMIQTVEWGGMGRIW
jgi:hypothetical protein